MQMHNATVNGNAHANANANGNVDNLIVLPVGTAVLVGLFMLTCTRCIDDVRRRFQTGRHRDHAVCTTRLQAGQPSEKIVPKDLQPVNSIPANGRATFATRMVYNEPHPGGAKDGPACRYSRCQLCCNCSIGSGGGRGNSSSSSSGGLFWEGFSGQHARETAGSSREQIIGDITCARCRRRLSNTARVASDAQQHKQRGRQQRRECI